MPAGESWPLCARSVARRRTTARWRGREGGQGHLCDVPDHRAGRRRVRRRPGADASMRRHGFLRANALSVGFGAVFLATLLGQAISGTAAYNAQQIADGLEPVSFLDYVTSSSFAVDVMENWQSEYLQFFLYIFATVWLVQRGSSQSQKPRGGGTGPDEDPPRGGPRGEEARGGGHGHRRGPARGAARQGGLAGLGPDRRLADGGLLPVPGAAPGRPVPADLGRLLRGGLGRLQQPAAGQPAGPGQLCRIPDGGGLLEPVVPELAVGDARRGLDDDLLRLPAPARLTGIQAGGRGARRDG